MFQYAHPNNLVSLYEDSVKKFATNRLFGSKNAQGDYEWITYQEFGERIDNLRSGLAQSGIEKDDKVGIIVRNSVEWAQIAFATYGLGGCNVPFYENESIEIIKYIINDCKLKIVFVANEEIKESIEEIKEEIPSLKRIIVLYKKGENTLEEIENLGKKLKVPTIHPLPSDMAEIIYTSGTTGTPKGVMLSHGNFASNALSGNRVFPELIEHSVSLSILPWAHSYGQLAELYNWLLFGGSIGIAGSTETLTEDFSKVKPTFLIAVPRIFNKIYDGIHLKMSEKGGITYLLFKKSLIVASKKRSLKEKGEESFFINIQHKFFDKIIFSKIRDVLGGRIEGSLTASATMNSEIGQFFFNIGIPVYDCYGLTETSPAVSMNSVLENHSGSVGKAIDDVKIVIDSSVVEEGAKDGEVIVYGPNVMMGYYNKPEETAKVIMQDGGFRTGDRGRLDKDGFLFITGRIKEQYKLQNGKYVFPTVIEEDIKLIPYIKNSFIFGDGQQYNTCIVVLDTELLKRYATEFSLLTNPIEIIKNKIIQDFISLEIKKHLEMRFKIYEIPRKYYYVIEDFTLENGFLTQTLKLKRRAVLEKYQDVIENMYLEH